MRVWVLPQLLSLLLTLSFVAPCVAQGSKQSDSPSSSSSRSRKTAKTTRTDSGLDAGSVTNGVYRNQSLGLSWRIPAGWVLRTEEMNGREDSVTPDKNPHPSTESSPQGTAKENSGGRVLLAAFSRPPEAKGEDVNGSVLIATESVATYPGLKEAVQYLGPLTEVAMAQGFVADEDPYEVAVGPKTLARADFHKNVGSRVMRQSTLVFLARGYAVSITAIGGTEDEVEGLIDALSFAGK